VINSFQFHGVVKVRENGEHYIEIPQDVLDELGWKEGDEFEMKLEKDFDLSPYVVLVKVPQPD